MRFHCTMVEWYWWGKTDKSRSETRPSAILVTLILRGLAWDRTRADFDGSYSKCDVGQYAVELSIRYCSSEMRICDLHVASTRCTTVRIGLQVSGCYTTTCMTTHPLTSSLDLFKGWYALFDLHSEPFSTKGGFPCDLPRHIGFSLYPPSRRHPISTSHESWQVSITFLISTAWFPAYWLNSGLLSPPTTLLTAGASDGLPLRSRAPDVAVQKVANLLRLWTSRAQISPQTGFLTAP